jgi:NitT/TauT family transport system substrate-binding protein
LKYFRRSVAGLAATAFLVSGCSDSGSEDTSDAQGSGSGGASGDLVDITLGLTAPPDVSHAIYDCVPRIAGFFEEEGLNVTTEITQGSSAGLQALESGVIDVAVVGASALMVANQAGSDFRAFHTSVTSNYAYPAVLPDSDIESLADLEGRTVGVPSAASGSVPHTKGLVAAEGGDPNSIDFLPVGVGAEALSALQSGDVDAIAHWDTIYAGMEATGAELRYLVSDVAEGMARAANKAYVFAEANPEAAVRACWEAFPELVPTGVDEETALENATTALEARLGAAGPVDDLYGYSSDAGIDAFIQLQVDAGAVQPGMSPEEVWTDEYVRAAQDFDVDEVRAYAEDWSP